MNDTIEALRQFNRQWSQMLGLLEADYLGSEHTLPEVRVLFELGQQPQWERMALRDQLQIDDSYLTRLLTRLTDEKLIKTSASKTDGRRRNIALTKKGLATFKELDRRSSDAMAALLADLSNDQHRTVHEALTLLPRLIFANHKAASKPVIRPLRSGDLGWVIQRHGEIYADEYGWDMDFEGLVAKIVADFYASKKTDRENAWIAEIDGVRAGCIFCCSSEDEKTALLRILLVEPWARGLGVGRTLVDSCIEFARGAGYTTLSLWTNDVLVSARKIYESAGFTLTDQDSHHSFGHDLIGQNWILSLNA